jgi:hypothetical protein
VFDPLRWNRAIGTYRPYYYANPWLLRTRHPEYDVEVIQCDVMLASDDIHGRVSSGLLVLRGLCLPAVCLPTILELGESDHDTKFKRACIIDVFGLGKEPSKENIVCSIDGDSHHDGDHFLDEWQKSAIHSAAKDEKNDIDDGVDGQDKHSNER